MVPHVSMGPLPSFLYPVQMPVSSTRPASGISGRAVRVDLLPGPNGARIELFADPLGEMYCTKLL